MPTFAYATLTQTVAALSARLYDGTNQFWSFAELTAYINEALRTWNALTSFWRGNFAFPLAANTIWYDVTTANNSLRPVTLQDTLLVNQIQYHLLEPLTASYPLTWTGSNQFAVSDILGAITRRQNQILGATGCNISVSNVAAPTNQGLNTVALADTTIDIRRVAWIPANNNGGYVPSVMRQGDIWEKRSFASGYLPANNGQPSIWIQNTDEQPGFNPDIIPAVPGNYECHLIVSGPTSNANNNQTLAVPDDWAWIVKWGALGDLLSRDGLAKDSTRAAYCQQRFAQGIKMLADSPAVLGLQINDTYPLFPDAVRNGDDFNPTWQAAAPAPPSSCYQSGLNLLGFNPPDANNNYTARAFVVQNAPIPANNNSFIQISRDDYDSLLDEAEHIAMFKCAGEEFLQTIPLHQNFLEHAGQYNRKLKEMGFFELDQEEISQRESQRRPMMAAETK